MSIEGPPKNPLLVPDDAAWWDHRAFSFPIRGRLTQVYQIVHRSTGRRAYEEALRVLRPCIGKRMMPFQQLNVFYMLSMCMAGIREFSDSKEWAEHAIELVGGLANDLPLVDLYVLRGAASRTVSQFRPAATDYLTALTILNAQPMYEQAGHLALRVQILAALPAYEFYLARYDQAHKHVAEGLSLVGNSFPVAKAQLLNTRALLYRWAGQATEATAASEGAVRLSAEYGNNASLVRYLTVYADAALDRAERHPSYSAVLERTHWLDEAAAAIREARTVARIDNDLNGEALAVITHARLTHLWTGRPDLAQADAHFGISVADDVEDLCLSAQSYTVRGNLMLAGGKLDEARGSYYKAYDAAKQSELPALNRWIERGLYNVHEMSERIGD